MQKEATMFYLLIFRELPSFIRALIARLLGGFDGIAARERSEPGNSRPVDLDDEWVNPWTRQQRRLKEALALAQQWNSSAKKPDSQS
jgi:hypothetical protein